MLRQKVETTFGNPHIAVSDTPALAQDILDKTGCQISPSTLQRFLGLVRTTSSPSRHTLDVISRYAAEAPYHSFLKKMAPAKDSSTHSESLGLDLLQLCLEDHHFDTVIKYLQRLPPEQEANQAQRMHIAAVLGTFIRRDRKAQKHLLPALAKIPQGRFYFFESFVDLDFLHVYFAHALDDYLKEVHRVGHATKKRDILFALNLQFRRDLFHGPKRAAAKTSYRIQQVETGSFDLGNQSSWFPVARTFFTEIMTEGLLRRRGNLDPLLAKMHAHHDISPKMDVRGYLLSESLQALFFLKEYSAIREIGLEYLPTIQQINKIESFHTPLVLILKEVDQHFGENHFSSLGTHTSPTSHTEGCEAYNAGFFIKSR